MIYDGLRVVDLTRGIAGAYCAKLLDRSRRRRRVHDADQPIRCSRTCARHSTTRATRRPWIDAADIVLVGEPGVVDGTVAARHGLDHPARARRTRRRTRPPGRSAAGAERQSLGARARGPAAVDRRRPPRRVRAGAFAALGAATAWWRASRTGIAERVDVSMLEAMQLTFVTVPTLMTRVSRRPADVAALGDDPGQRAHRRRALRRDHDRHGRSSGRRSARLMGRADLADDDELGDDDGARQARRRGERRSLHAWTRAAHRRRDRRARVSRRASRPRSSATAPSCRAIEQLAAREVFVRQPGEDWIRPPRAVPVPRRRRSRARRGRRGRRAVGARGRRRVASRRMQSASDRWPGCACSTSPRSGRDRSPPRGWPRWVRT